MTSEIVMNPVPPGEILLKEFLVPLGVSQYRLAKAISVPARRINEIVHGHRRISADTALRLARAFGTSERFWLNSQSRYDLETEKDRLGADSMPSSRCRPRANSRAWPGVTPLWRENRGSCPTASSQAQRTGRAGTITHDTILPPPSASN